MKIQKLHRKYQALWKWNKHKSRYTIITGGRGSGKSFVTSFFLADLMDREPGQVIMYSRKTLTKVSESIMPEIIEKIKLLGMESRTRVLNDRIEHKNGSVLYFAGLTASNKSNTALGKGIKNISTLVIDEAEEVTDEGLFDDLDFSIRTNSVANRVILIMNPSNVHHWIYKRFFAHRADKLATCIEDGVCYIHTTYKDLVSSCPGVLSQSAISQWERLKETNLAKYMHKIMGHWMKDVEGALWNNEMVNDAKDRKYKEGDIEKIIVAVDPSVSSTGDQDVCGIVVCAKLKDDAYAIIEDASAVLSPQQWGKRVIEMYEKYEANYVVAEINQGGDLVELNIKAAAPGTKIKVKKVRASKGKVIRAEPIVTLYEDNRVSHRPKLGELELELITYTGAKGEDSPGRLDALVWGLTDLSKKKRQAYASC